MAEKQPEETGPTFEEATLAAIEALGRRCGELETTVQAHNARLHRHGIPA